MRGNGSEAKMKRKKIFGTQPNASETKPGPGLMAQTPRAGTGDSVIGVQLSLTTSTIFPPVALS